MDAASDREGDLTDAAARQDDRGCRRSSCHQGLERRRHGRREIHGERQGVYGVLRGGDGSVIQRHVSRHGVLSFCFYHQRVEQWAKH